MKIVVLEFDNFRLTIFGVITIFLTILIARVSVWLIKKYLTHKTDSRKIKLEFGRRYALFQIIKYGIYSLAFLLVITTLGVNLSLILAGSAALFVGIGFGLQKTFNDFFSGIIILFEGTIEVNDIIEVDDLFGMVQKIGLRTTEIKTIDSISIIVPNSKITEENVVNWSHDKSSTRFHVSVPVAYGSDIAMVKRAILESADAHELVLDRPAPVVRFKDYGGSSLDFDLMYWTNNPFQVTMISSDLRYMIETRFRKYGVEIPFSQHDLHIKSDFRHRPDPED
jgi:small-conductance mechanosensitive channel